MTGARSTRPRTIEPARRRRLGIHVRTGSGLLEAARRAREAGCNTFQIMSGNPSAWNPGRLDPAQAAAFCSYIGKYDLRPVFLHAGYLINLSCRRGRNAPLYAKSIRLLAASIERARALGCEYVVVHTGSRKGGGEEEALAALTAALRRLDEQVNAGAGAKQAPGGGSPMLLLENSAGQGDSTGSTLEELASMLDASEEAGVTMPLGICLDTAHMWGAGYDLSSVRAVRRIVNDIDSGIGLERLHCIHYNDAAVEMGSRKDRHEHPGRGVIPVEGLRALARSLKLRRVPLIMETPGKTEPGDSERMQDLFELAGVRPGTGAS